MNATAYTLILCAISSVGTFAFVTAFYGLSYDFGKLVLFFIWPLSPYGFIAALSYWARRSTFWARALFICCCACILIAVARFLMIWYGAAVDPMYADFIIVLGLLRAPLEQWISLIFILLFSALAYSSPRRR
jgi:hypothetical protein